MSARDIATALQSLRPNAEWVLRGDDLSGLEWHDEASNRPSDQEILDEIARLEQEKINNLYKEQRAAEYPDFRDYLDGIVKGDQTQIQAYIDACLSVKSKYPKPGAGS